MCLNIMSFYAHAFFYKIQGVSEIRVLILTSENTHQFMKFLSIIFSKKSQKFSKIFTKRVVLCD
jgi:hypothetical protein